MPLINLIQEQRLQIQREEKRNRLFFMSFVGSAVAATLAFGFLLFQKEGAASELAQLQAQQQKLAPLLKQIEENGRAISVLSPRVKTLEDAQATTGKWSRILDHLMVQMPANTWLTGLRCQVQDPTKPINMTFIGMAEDQDRVGELILRLQNSPDLTAVNLRQTIEKAALQGTGIEFEISGDIEGSATEKPKDETKQEGQ